MSGGVGWRERGSASVLLLAVAGTLTLVSATLALLATGIVARHQAAAAADLGALAGAIHALDDLAVVCEAARAVVAANNATLVDCRVEGWEVVVITEVTVGGAAELGPARAVARAGPW
ncbi:MAG: helicase [Longispora sp.]|nr:helicase [Longispora sp. (in: high G+C Gram-positive bacteria)]